MTTRPSPHGEAGFSLVQVVAITAVMLILMSAGVPTWRYVMQDAREEELIFRGGQIADAIARYQKKNGNALPPSLEVLVKGKFLRKAYKDPMTADGKWRFVRPGEVQGGGGGRHPGRPGPPPPSPSPGASPSPGMPGGPAGTPGSDSPGGIGAFVGVASVNPDKSLRMFNGKTRYSDWVFAAGLPRIVGITVVGGPNPGAPQAPGSTPSPPVNR